MSNPASPASKIAPPEAPPPSAALVPKKPLVMRIGKYLQPRINGIVARSSRIGDHVFYDPADFPWIAEIEARWREIRDEASVVLQDLNAIPPLAEISPDHRRIAPAGKWRSFFLCGYGYRVPDNCAACPTTAAMIAKVPGLNSALFSILAPGTHIPLHTGVTKAFLTCHVGLKVPQRAEDCAMHVDGRRVTWREGKALVFDDMHQHEVLNDTDEIRVVLLVQFRRPMRPLGWVLGNLFLWGVKRSRFVQEARRGVEQWRQKPAAETD